MFDFENLPHRCPGCMKEKPEGQICPFCGFSEDADQFSPLLPLKTVIDERYLVGRALETNGEGVTYIGYDLTQDSTVRIREYLPAGLCVREDKAAVRITAGHEYTYNQGLMTFLELARSLARMRELPALLPVYDIFESGGTAYYVSETIESVTLREFLLRNGGSLSWEQARPIFMPLLSAIGALHNAGIIHRAISPETIIIGRDGKLRLTGFCIADVRAARSDFSPQLFAGFAAIEQYGFEGAPGEWTDVYGFTATLYRVLVGNTPPEATARVTNDRLIIPAAVAERLPAYVMDAMSGGLQILPEDRTQNMDILREELSAAPSVTNRQNLSSAKTRAARNADPDDVDEDEEEYLSPKKNSGKYALLALAGTLALVAVIGAVLMFTVFRKAIFGDGNSNPIVSAVSRPPVQSVVSLAPDPSEPTLIAVPAFTGLTYKDVTENIEYTSKFKFEVSGYDLSDTQGKGKIISQTPKKGEPVAAGTVVKLVVSLGPKKITLPNLEGMTEAEAEYALLKAGVIAGNIDFTPKWDDKKDPGKVISTDPGAGKSIDWYASVTVYINSYEPPPVSSEAASSEASSSEGGGWWE